MWASRKKPSGKTGQNVGVGPDMWHILPIGTALSFYLLEDYMPSLATCSLFVKRSTKTPLQVRGLFSKHLVCDRAPRLRQSSNRAPGGTKMTRVPAMPATLMLGRNVRGA